MDPMSQQCTWIHQLIYDRSFPCAWCNNIPSELLEAWEIWWVPAKHQFCRIALFQTKKCPASQFFLRNSTNQYYRFHRHVCHQANQLHLANTIIDRVSPSGHMLFIFYWHTLLAVSVCWKTNTVFSLISTRGICQLGLGVTNVYQHSQSFIVSLN